jgi:metal-sulfur cluster biosynthetic enzyme
MTDVPQPVKQEDVIEVLKNVYDPELQMDIVNLGLIYGVEVGDGNAVRVKMTLTSPACPYGPALIAETKNTVLMLHGVKTADVELVFTPPWGPERMSEEARLELGLDI